MQQGVDISVTQAAKILGSAGKTIVNYCMKGKLTGEKNPVTGIWKINLESVMSMKDKAGGGGL